MSKLRDAAIAVVGYWDSLDSADSVEFDSRKSLVALKDALSLRIDALRYAIEEEANESSS